MYVQKVPPKLPYLSCAGPALAWVELTLIYFLQKKVSLTPIHLLYQQVVWCTHVH